MANILITAGPVHAPLDDNKIISNRVRGIWAWNIARRLHLGGHQITMLLPDYMRTHDPLDQDTRDFRRLYHRGFKSYRAECQMLAPQMDAAILAAAVVNWIPSEPVKGKMTTKGYKAGAVIQIPFTLAPRVLADMRPANPKLNLVGCKLCSGVSYGEMIDAAYGLLLDSHCNLVVANDLKNLHCKYLVYPDRTVVSYLDRWDDFNVAVSQVLTDEYYSTVVGGIHPVEVSEEKLHWAKYLFDKIADLYRDRFLTIKEGEHQHTFGAIAVNIQPGLWLCSPRHKMPDFTSADAVVTRVDVENLEVNTLAGKATLNAPYMLAMGEGHKAPAVLHLHEQVPDWDTLPYAPPGTKRDRIQYGEEGCHSYINIKGHGFVACLDEDCAVWKNC